MNSLRRPLPNPQSFSARNEKCPHCQSELENAVCPSCGWAVIEYPDIIPDALAEFERRRYAAFESGSNNARQAATQADEAAGKVDQLNKRIAELTQERDHLDAELRTARSNAGTAAPKAFIVITDKNDPDRLDALAVGTGETRFRNQAAINLNPSVPGTSQRIRMMSNVPVDFIIESLNDGRFRLRDMAGGVMYNGMAVDKAHSQAIINGSKITFEKIQGWMIGFSIPSTRR